jgi:hypothetical protein
MAYNQNKRIIGFGPHGLVLAICVSHILLGGLHPISSCCVMAQSRILHMRGHGIAKWWGFHRSTYMRCLRRQHPQMISDQEDNIICASACIYSSALEP